MVQSTRNLSLAPSLCVKGFSSEVPKKPPTPWTAYFTQEFPKYKKVDPSASTPDLMRRISEAWKQVSETEKEKLQAVYQKEKELYQQKMAKVPEDILNSAKSVKSSKRADKSKKSAADELKALLKATNKPTRNLSAYLLYSGEMRPKLPESLSVTEKTKKLAADWNNAPDSVKQKYNELSAKDGERYQKELEAWTRKTERDGTASAIEALQTKVAALKKRSKEAKV